MKNIDFEKEMRRDKRIFELNQRKGYWSYPNAPQALKQIDTNIDVDFDEIYKRTLNKDVIQITQLDNGYKVVYNGKEHIIDDIKLLKDTLNELK